MKPEKHSPLHVLFVDLSHDIYDRHGVYALSAVLGRAGVRSSYISGKDKEVLIRKIKNMNPQLVLYSSFSHTLNAYRTFDAALKKQVDVYSILGGPGPTFNPAYIDDTTIQASCVGEGDYALPQFIANGFAGGKNFYIKGKPWNNDLNSLANLDSLPFPNRDTVYISDPLRGRLSSKQFISGRGCPYLCTYCFNHSYNKLVKECGSVVRKKSVDYLCEEILQVKKHYPLSMAVFNDDTFIINNEWLLKFADLYPVKVGIPYSCNIRANLINEEIVRALKESGCVAVNWSIESGDETYRNSILKRNITDEQILNTAELLNRYKIKHRIGNLIGLPGETPEQIRRTIEINIKAGPTYSLANIFVPYPGLDLTQYAVQSGFCQETPEDKLPENYFIRSSMIMSHEANLSLRRLVYIFPLFVKFPVLFYSQFINRFMFRIPLILQRVAYELFFGFMFRKVYRVKSDMITTLQLFWRHIKSITG